MEKAINKFLSSLFYAAKPSYYARYYCKDCGWGGENGEIGRFLEGLATSRFMCPNCYSHAIKLLSPKYKTEDELLESEKLKYKAKVVCGNCGWGRPYGVNMELIKGRPVSAKICPKCSCRTIRLAKGMSRKEALTPLV
ncbi:MAG: hypothetical protein QXT63_08865, partial [Thermoplasmata archaeon]